MSLVSAAKNKALDLAFLKYKKILEVRHNALKVVLDVDTKVNEQKIKKFKEKIERLKNDS